MKKVEIKYYQLLFLYTYLRQIDLSLDRSRWNSWNELQNYFELGIQPTSVIKYLKNYFQLSESNFNNDVLLKRKTSLNKLQSIFLKRFFLDLEELLYCCELLWTFDKLLKSNIEKYNSETEQLRIDMAKFYTKTLGTNILNKDLDRIMSIEHFAQSDKIQTIELKIFVPDDFLTPGNSLLK